MDWVKGLISKVLAAVNMVDVMDTVRAALKAAAAAVVAYFSAGQFNLSSGVSAVVAAVAAAIASGAIDIFQARKYLN